MSVEQDVDKACETVGASDPLAFLAAVAAGVDPREKATVYTIINDIDEDNFGGAPDHEQWEELLDAARNTPNVKFKPVSLDVSMTAVKTLAEYKHPKRKSVELSVDGGQVTLPPLSSEEMDVFEEWFNDQF